jgi:hypothetical protein
MVDAVLMPTEVDHCWSPVPPAYGLPAPQLGDASRNLPREVGSDALPSCAAGQQEGGKKNQESTGNDQRQRKLEERSHYQLADQGIPCHGWHAATKELAQR